MGRKPSQQLREARQEIERLGIRLFQLDQNEVGVKETVRYYIEKAEEASKEAQEQRERRLAVEAEVEAMADLALRTGFFARIGDRIDRVLTWR